MSCIISLRVPQTVVTCSEMDHIDEFHNSNQYSSRVIKTNVDCISSIRVPESCVLSVIFKHEVRIKTKITVTVYKMVI